MVNKKRRGLKININLSNRAIYTILAIIIVVLAGVAVWAATPGVSHSLDELTGEGTIGGVLTISGGKVGIGTDIPGAKLVVSGGKILHEDGTAKAELFAASATGKVYVGSYSDSPFVLRTNDQDRVTIDTSGNVGIGTATPGAKLDVAGTVEATGLDVAGDVKIADNSGTFALGVDTSDNRYDRGFTMTASQSVLLVAGSLNYLENPSDTTTAINDGAYDGQILILVSFETTRYIVLKDNANTVLAGDWESRPDGRSITLIWNAGESNWIELSRSSN